jgi:SmpA / OmlA family
MRVRTTAGVCLLLAAGGSACGDFGGVGEVDCATYNFPTREWRETEKVLDRRPDDEEALEGRRRAADGLVKCRVLQGKTKRQVLRILGQPYIEHSREHDAFDYVVGQERGPVSVDAEFLSITFKRNRVTKTVTYVG